MTKTQQKSAVFPPSPKQATQFQARITCCIPRADDQEEYGVGTTPATILTNKEELQ